MKPNLATLLTEDEAADLLRISARTLRASGNLKAVSRLLDHTDVTTTAKYAHALEDDIRAMLLATETGQKNDSGPEIFPKPLDRDAGIIYRFVHGD